jgi:phage terminase large subunit
VHDLDYILEIPKLEIEKNLFRQGDFDFITITNDKHHIKQQQALEYLTDNETEELAYGGAAGGAKSWTGACWLTFMCECFAGTRWFVGRETLKDLRESTLITFFKVFKHYGVEGVRFNGVDHFLEFANGSRIDFLELRFFPSDPLYERFGSKEYTGGWIEEAGETTFNAYDAIKTRIGRHLNDVYNLLGKIFITLNPKKNWVHTYFWKPYKAKELPENIKFLVALVTDNPYIESGYMSRLQQIKDKIRKQRLLYGNFDYDDDDNMLMTYDAIDDLFNCETRIQKTGRKYLIIDVARFGKDESKFYVFDENLVIERFTLKHKRTTEVAEKAKQIAARHNIPMSRILADEDGVGGGVVDILGCKGFVNGSSPLDNPKMHTKENYENLRTQCSYMAAESVNKGESGFADEVINNAFKEKFTEEAEQVKRKDPDTDKKLKIVPKEDVKKEIGRSPDDWDCFMMRQWFELTPKRYIGVIHSASEMKVN